MSSVNPRYFWVISLLIIVCLINFPAQAQYSGGTGEPNNPYQISEPNDWIEFMNTSDDWEGEFVLIADIDLNGISLTPVGTSSSKSFKGVFDGKGYIIYNAIVNEPESDYIGLFGYLNSTGKILNLGTINTAITGERYVGAIVGRNYGIVNNCYSTGIVNGQSYDVGGLIGYNSSGDVNNCSSTGTVSGQYDVGGLAGYNSSSGIINRCYSTGIINGQSNYVGGLVGYNYGTITNCYSTGTVSGKSYIGGLVGYNYSGTVTSCYSTGIVNGQSDYIGGLVGFSSNILYCVWDVETSGLSESYSGVGLTTTEMMDPYILSYNGFANNPNWVLDAGNDYPRLVWQGTQGEIIPEIDMQGNGTVETPYHIDTAEELILLDKASILWDKNLVLDTDINLAPDMNNGKVFGRAIIPTFMGVFDGNGHIISNVAIEGSSYLGVFGQLESGAEVMNLGIVDVNISGSGDYVGALVGYNNKGTVTNCYCTGTISGQSSVGGLVGYNNSTINNCYSTGMVNGISSVGGLCGVNSGNIITSYSAGGVIGQSNNVGGLVGFSSNILYCVWDIETSGLSESHSGVGLTTVEMMDPYILSYNGFANNPNWVLDAGNDYPRLAWQGTQGEIIPEADMSWLEGNGTTEIPYQIHTAEQLVMLEKKSILWNKNFILDADINLAPDMDNGRAFDGALISTFVGVFNGNNHIISNIVIEGTSYLGIFGQLGPDAEVMNLGIVDVNISGSGDYIGALTGYNDGGTVINCYSKGIVSGQSYVGGIIGYNEGFVSRCYSDGFVSGNSCVGGLVGCNFRIVFQCYSTSVVSGEDCVGGFAGSNCRTLFQCYCTGMVTGTSSVGGLVGSDVYPYPPYFSMGYVIQSFWDIETSGQARSVGGTGKTTAEMQDTNIFINAGWDFLGQVSDGLSEIWNCPEGGGYPVLSILSGYNPPDLQGKGTQENPYLISNASELGAIIYYSKKSQYQLTGPVDLSGICWGIAVIPFFEGNFDGNYYTISNLTIKGESSLGLFGSLSPDANVNNLLIEDVNIVGSGSGVGGLAGINEGTVTNCCSTGVVVGDYCTGGLVGYNSPMGVLNQCFTTGSVYGSSYVGGLAGQSGEEWIDNHGTVSQCYSNAMVSGSSYVGGLVGYNFNTLTECYSTGAVSGNSSVGGLVGSGQYHDPYIVKQSYWDQQTSGQRRSAVGTGKTTKKMKSQETYAGWDFVCEAYNGVQDIWWIQEGIDYPKLKWQLGEVGDGYSGGTGEPNDPYQIASAAELMLLNKSTEDYDKCFILTGDIDLNPILPFGGIFNAAVIAGNYNPYLFNYQDTTFTGVFDGNNHIIQNLRISGEGYLGLFGHLGPGAEIKNLGIVDCNITGTDIYIGGLVGKNNSGNITNCYVIGSISRKYEFYNHFDYNYIGGLIGYNYDSVINDCYVSGSVSGDGIYIGGLIGWSELSSINGCHAGVSVSGTDFERMAIGGLVGYNKGSISNCYAVGSVNGTLDIGGLVGYSLDSIITGCHTKNQVDGMEYIGGLVGRQEIGSITDCFVNGPVSGHSFIGGLVGGNSGSITASYSTSKVNGYDNVGGLVGDNNGNISTSYSTSTVSGDYDIGGLVGSTYGNITNCYASGSAKGQSSVGGLCGYLSYSNVTDCYAAGGVLGLLYRGKYYVGGLIGRNHGGYVNASFWDIETSGVSEGIGEMESDPNEVAGKTTEQMWSLNIFTDAGWDFADEAVNGANDIWKIIDGLDYPHFWYEKYGGGSGEPNDPYRIATVDNLLLLSESSDDYNKHFILIDDIDLDPNLPGRKVFDRAVIAPDTNDMEALFQGNSFTGVFDGDGYKISNLTIIGNSYLGLFGQLGGGEVKNLGVVEVDIFALGFFAGSIVGYIDQGCLAACYSNGIVSGETDVGGLAGDNAGIVTQCYSTNTVCGNTVVGGLIGYNLNVLYHCYSAGEVTGNSSVGGLLGLNIGDVNNCFWDIQTSGQVNSVAGTGKTTSEMKTQSTFTSAGWDFFGEIINGTNDIWWIYEGMEYPQIFEGEIASNPSPEDGAEIYDCTEIQLRWKSGLEGAVYNVYFGTEMNDVYLADINNTFGVLLSQNQSGTNFDVVSLDYDNTYYWRIDEVRDGIIIIGNVWHFTLKENRKTRCFTGQTRVWSDGMLIPFSNISKEQPVNGIDCLSKIEELQIHEGSFICHDLLLDSGNSLTVVDNHYFMTESGQWISLKNLKAGTKLKSAKGLTEIKSITKIIKPYTGSVYNLKILDSDYYLVGLDGIIARDY